MHDARHDPAADGEHTRYDLRTATQAEADTLAALSLRIDGLYEALHYLTRRVQTLEGDSASLRGTVSGHDDALQALTLRGDDGR